MATAPTILNTFALSHFCENARWALDYKGVSYTEESWAPMLHMLRTWRLNKTYTPVLKIDGRVLQESADICAYLEEHFPEPALIPAQHRDEVLRVADEGRSLGPHVRRMAYFSIGQDLSSLEKAWVLNVSPAEAGIHKLVFPVSRRLAFKALRVNPEAAAKSEAIVRDFLEQRDASFSTPTRFLVGDSFTLADLTMASMLSPLVRPAEHPFYPKMAYGEAGEAALESMRGYRMLDWVRDCYARHRWR
ncbi:MAG: glutathione S-transferase family protein [Polyangiales bacterium]